MIEQSVEGSFSSSLVDNSLSQSESLQLRALLGESDAQWYPKFHSERLIIATVLNYYACGVRYCLRWQMFSVKTI